jgi:hypothetical protein
MRRFLLMVILTAIPLTGCSSALDKKMAKEYPETVMLRLHNPLAQDRKDEVVSIPIAMLKAKAASFNPQAVLVLAGEQEIPAQLVDADGDGSADQILANLDFKAGETRKLKLHYATTGIKERIYRQRTQAELSVKFGGKWVDHKYVGGTFHNIDALRIPPEHTDHSEYIRYEGPGWESDKVGYRFYLDWRNASDIYGKKTSELVLQNVGQEDFETYHHMADWGMDILKVGESLGIGSIAWWDGTRAVRVAVTDSIHCRIATVGPLLSRIRTDYFNWKFGSNSLNLHSDLSICAGSRLSRQELQLSGEADNLCTGLVKLPDTEMVPPPASGAWSWLATWGMQSLNNDRLGMAILYRRADLIEQTEDSLSHVVVLQPSGGHVVYYFLAAWELEPGGVTSKEAFAAALAETAARLNQPVIIE